MKYDLCAFLGEGPLSKLILVEDKIVATNGKILVAIPASEEDKKEIEIYDKSKHPKLLPDLIHTLDEINDGAPVPKIGSIILSTEKCTNCNESGIVAECTDCDGSGEVELYSDSGICYENECRLCSGTGNIPPESDTDMIGRTCPVCNGSTVVITYKKIKIRSSVVDGKLLQEFNIFSNLRVKLTDTVLGLDPIRLIFNEGKGIIMPIRAEAFDEEIKL